MVEGAASLLSSSDPSSGAGGSSRPTVPSGAGMSSRPVIPEGLLAGALLSPRPAVAVLHLGDTPTKVALSATE